MVSEEDEPVSPSAPVSPAVEEPPSQAAAAEDVHESVPNEITSALLNLKLPPLPNAALRVAELVRDPNTSASTIADAIGYDPALAARILRAANSSLYSRERHVSTLTVAVNMLGARTLYQLAISYAASSLFDRPTRPSVLESELWRHSVFVGLAARAITLRFGLHGSEETFLSGLLHDVGKSLMIQHDPKLYAPLAEITNDDDLLAGELAVYGLTHPRASALVVNHWGLSPDISDAIMHHHNPDDAVHSILMCRALSVANKLANSSEFGITQISMDELEADESVYLLDLSGEGLGQIREQAEESMSEMMYILSK